MIIWVKYWNDHISTWSLEAESRAGKPRGQGDADFFQFNIYFICSYAYACVYVHTSAVSLRPEEGVGSLGTRGTGGCELPAEGAGH